MSSGISKKPDVKKPVKVDVDSEEEKYVDYSLLYE